MNSSAIDCDGSVSSDRNLQDLDPPFLSSEFFQCQHEKPLLQVQGHDTGCRIQRDQAHMHLLLLIKRKEICGIVRYEDIAIIDSPASDGLITLTGHTEPEHAGRLCKSTLACDRGERGLRHSSISNFTAQQGGRRG